MVASPQSHLYIPVSTHWDNSQCVLSLPGKFGDICYTAQSDTVIKYKKKYNQTLIKGYAAGRKKNYGF